MTQNPSTLGEGWIPTESGEGPGGAGGGLVIG